MPIYVCIDDHWFDLTEFKEHPGGYRIFNKYHMKDATDIFNEIKGHHDEYCYGLMKKYEIKDEKILEKIKNDI
jgi:cytochrome b involved in lipid metabolism